MGATESKAEPVSETVADSPYEKAVKLIENHITKNKTNITFDIKGLKELPPIPERFTRVSVYRDLEVFPRLHNGISYLFLHSCNIPEIDTTLVPKNIEFLQIKNCQVQEIKGDFSTFKQLHNLNTSYNHLSSIPELPKNILAFDCSGNQLTSLPNLPDSLHTLECGNNPLNSLPELPKNLESLICNNNQLTSLELPKNLYDLNCSDNQLTSLPKLPNSLDYLGCDDNQLTSLPKLPKNLKTLSCNNNQLTSLPKLPEGMVALYAYNNKLTSLPKIPKSMLILNIYENNIDLETIPSVTKEILCDKFVYETCLLERYENFITNHSTL